MSVEYYETFQLNYGEKKLLFNHYFLKCSVYTLLKIIQNA